LDIHQLRTFVAVAREGSITRASEVLHLSQPAVSAHIKAIEDALGLSLFERTARGMSLTAEGQRLLAKAEGTLGAHRELMAEATRLKGHLTGTLRLGASKSTSDGAPGKLVAAFASRWPDVEVVLEHDTSTALRARLRSGALDAIFYNEGGDADADLATVEVSRFGTHVAAAPGLVPAGDTVDWAALGELSWIYPPSSTCCGKTAESLFRVHRFQPKRVVSVDREDVTRTLVAQGLGVGLLHEAAAKEACDRGEVVLLASAPTSTRVLFALLASRAQDPLVDAAAAIVRESVSAASR
jgi:DNA-binding transcriptional LysR family regulator